MKKIIAFIDKYVSDFQRCLNPNLEMFEPIRDEMQGDIVRGLNRHFEVDTYSNLWPSAEKFLSNDCPAYFAIITHVPYVIGENPYEKSLEMIKNIHEKFPYTVIIAYTGANEKSLPEDMVKEYGISYILRKTEHAEKDLEQILEWIS